MAEKFSQPDKNHQKERWINSHFKGLQTLRRFSVTEVEFLNKIVIMPVVFGNSWFYGRGKIENLNEISIKGGRD